MNKAIFGLLFVTALSAHAAQPDSTQHQVTAQGCNFAESFIVDAYFQLDKGNPNAANNISTNINNSRNLDMRVGARAASSFINEYNIWGAQYKQWANQNVQTWCKNHIGQSI